MERICITGTLLLWYCQFKTYTNKGLYDYFPSGAYVKSVASENSMQHPMRTETNIIVTNLKENKKIYTQRQFYQSRRSRKPYQNVVCPTVENVKHLLRQNNVNNWPVKTEDVKICEQSFVPTMGKLK